VVWFLFIAHNATPPPTSAFNVQIAQPTAAATTQSGPFQTYNGYTPTPHTTTKMMPIVLTNFKKTVTHHPPVCGLGCEPL